jgi:hypothetical protein
LSPDVVDPELVRRVVDAAVERLRREQPDSPLLRLPDLELRRRLAEAHLRDLRRLRREMEEGSAPG